MYNPSLGPVGTGVSNAAFDGDSYYETEKDEKKPKSDRTNAGKVGEQQQMEIEDNQRDTWTNPIEFLLSCISMSVGLGNVWRFSFTAYENGGGAFLIPYIIVLMLIGKPLYFLEMVLGQFASCGTVKVWASTPIAKGIGYGQAMATWFVVTYYAVLMAQTVFYLFSSFQTVLPWTQCDPAWATDRCFSPGQNFTNITDPISSVEEFFERSVLKKSFNIDDGIGSPDWRLTLCLLLSWLLVCLALIKGVKSSGKVAYFTAIFPYVVLITLLIRGVTLDGAAKGIMFFITPQWDKLFTVKIWYSAVTQCFYSMGIGFGPIIMLSSFNPFKHNIYRDAAIVSFMDTFTSLLSGVTIFAILGNLAHESNKEIADVVQGGPGLAFISYPEALAKFGIVPQLFAVLFFLMLLTLGVGSEVTMAGSVITVVCDAFPNHKRWFITIICCSVGFLLGIVYVTPGGQFVLDIVDYFGGGFIMFVIALLEIIAVSWIYGLKNILKDVEFMLGIRLGYYWKFTWGLFIPVTLISIFIYSIFNLQEFKSGDYVYPSNLIVAGWLLSASALIQIPIWGVYVIYKQKNGTTLFERFKNSFKPSQSWGPKDAKKRVAWLNFKEETEDPTLVPDWMYNTFISICEYFQSCRRDKRSASVHIGSVPNESNSASTADLAKVTVDSNPYHKR